MTSVFPYLVCYVFTSSELIADAFQPEMIESFNVPKEEVASWAGMYVSQACIVPFPVYHPKQVIVQSRPLK